MLQSAPKMCLISFSECDQCRFKGITVTLCPSPNTDKSCKTGVDTDEESKSLLKNRTHGILCIWVRRASISDIVLCQYCTEDLCLGRVKSFRTLSSSNTMVELALVYSPQIAESVNFEENMFLAMTVGNYVARYY